VGPVSTDYREFRVTGPLGGLVECGWRAVTPPSAAAVTAILPDGCMDLMWAGSQLVVAGPDTAPHPYRRQPGRPTWGLRFRPGRLPALLGVPAAHLRDTRVPLAELNPLLVRRIGDRLGDLADSTGTAAAGHRMIAALADVATALPGGPPEPDVPLLAGLLDATGPAPSATELAATLGCTTRTLHRRCLAAFGYGPSVLRRVLRFRRATDLLRAGSPPAAVAADTGYADQPHLSRELRVLGGFSPTALARAG
jgi:AraC-like DNA-binding protein